MIQSPEIDRQYDAALADAQRANGAARGRSGGPVSPAAEAETQVGAAQVAQAQVATAGAAKSYEVLRAVAGTG